MPQTTKVKSLVFFETLRRWKSTPSRMFSRVVSAVLALLLVCGATLACAQFSPYDLSLDIKQIEDRKFATHASFKLPLKQCQAWRYLVDYKSSASIPCVL